MGLEAAFVGRAVYASDISFGTDRLFVAVDFRFPSQGDEHIALLDTGAEWCVIDLRLLEDLGLAPSTSDPQIAYRTRFGRLKGRLCRRQITLVAEEGEEVTIDATVFASEEWAGPNVLGWKGGLERLRSA